MSYLLKTVSRRGTPFQPGHRRPTLCQRVHGKVPREQHTIQAGCRHPNRGGGPGPETQPFEEQPITGHKFQSLKIKRDEVSFIESGYWSMSISSAYKLGVFPNLHLS